jgi:hypothetical protein
MNVLDENIIHSQKENLRQWRIPCRQMGEELSRSGVQDSEVIPLLMRLKAPTFFTRDLDYFQPQLRHSRYCLVWLNIRPDEAAFYMRQFLRHPGFRTHEQRLGRVVRVHAKGLEFWQLGDAKLYRVEWLA